MATKSSKVDRIDEVMRMAMDAEFRKGGESVARRERKGKGKVDQIEELKRLIERKR